MDRFWRPNLEPDVEGRVVFGGGRQVSNTKAVNDGAASITGSQCAYFKSSEFFLLVIFLLLVVL